MVWWRGVIKNCTFTRNIGIAYSNEYKLLTLFSKVKVIFAFLHSFPWFLDFLNTVVFPL